MTGVQTCALPILPYVFTGEGDDAVGAALAGAGDLDGDGLPDIAVGAPGTSGGDGAVHLFVRPLTDGIAVPWATLEGGGSEAAGTALALADDYDGDGQPDLAVGAPLNDSGGTDAGMAYLFSGLEPGTEPMTTAYVRFQGEAEGDQAGTAVAGLGDITGDGWPDFGIGAPFAENSGAEVGTTYVVPGLGGY